MHEKRGQPHLQRQRGDGEAREGARPLDPTAMALTPTQRPGEQDEGDEAECALN
jgi:hypothetical protein